MKKISLSKILDEMTLFAIVFFLSLLWIKIFVNDLLLAFVLAFLTSVCVVRLRGVRIGKKHSKMQTEKDKISHIEQISNYFLFSSFEENSCFFEKVLAKEYETEIKESYLLLRKSNDSIALFLFFEKKKLTVDELASCYKLAKNIDVSRIVICCNEVDASISQVAKGLSKTTIVLDKTQTYDKILCKYNLFPDIEKGEKITEKIKFLDILKTAFLRRKAKNYIFFGFLLLFSSFFVRYNICYVIFSSLMFVFALICFFSKSIFKQEERKEII